MGSRCFFRPRRFQVLALGFLTLLWSACEQHPSSTDIQDHIVILQPDSDPSLEEARIAPDRLPPLDYTYRNRGEDFEIRFPGKPQVSSSMIPSPQGQIELITISYDYSITKAYWASYSDYPTELISSRLPIQILRDARQSVVEGLGQSTNFGDVSDSVRQGYPSLRFRARDAHFHAVYELILVENRLFQLGVLRDGKFPQDQDVEAFFGSFAVFNKD